jgi:hypothetical protein
VRRSGCGRRTAAASRGPRLRAAGGWRLAGVGPPWLNGREPPPRAGGPRAAVSQHSAPQACRGARRPHTERCAPPPAQVGIHPSAAEELVTMRSPTRKVRREAPVKAAA